MTSCWVVTEGIAGTENQCLGVARALGIIPKVKRISLNQPWKLLSPLIGFESRASFSGDLLDPPYPEIILASGRKAIAASRYIKKQSKGKTFCVFIQDPRVNPNQFDLVCVPSHDPTRGENVIITDAAPNKITKDRLADAYKEFDSALNHLPSKRVAVLIGGSSKAYNMSIEITKRLCSQLISLADDGYGLMITASRRTGDENQALLKEKLSHKNIYYWDGTGSNPYFGFLAHAQYILVTADSTSMISESASTGKPVYVIDLEGGSERIKKMHSNLISKGVLRNFEGALEDYQYTPLNDAKLIADEIRKRLKLA